MLLSTVNPIAGIKAKVKNAIVFVLDLFTVSNRTPKAGK
jgi:hypothetical protein